MWGFFTYQCFVFFLIFAFFCLILSSFPLLLDFLKPKNGPLNEDIGIYIYNSGHLKPPEHFQMSLPASTAGECLFFFRTGSSQSCCHGIPSSCFFGRAFHAKSQNPIKEGKSAINLLEKESPCVSKQCPADGVWGIGRGGSPDTLRELRWTRFTPSEST